MKKGIANILIFLLVLTSLMSGCGTNSDKTSPENALNNSTQKITLTNDNFEEYFVIKTNSVMTVKKHPGEVWYGHKYSDSYQGIADVDVSVFASVPLKSYNVTVTICIPTDNIWEEKQETFVLTSAGSGSANFTLKTGCYLSSSQFSREDFSARLISVEGYIEIY